MMNTIRTYGFKIMLHYDKAEEYFRAVIAMELRIILQKQPSLEISTELGVLAYHQLIV